MKKYLQAFLSVVILLAGAQAAELNKHSSITSITDALKLQDDSYVTIRGNIVKKISSDKYIFKDATGTITVEIDDDKWGDIGINEKNTLELTGEIEKKSDLLHLDVDKVKKVN